MSQSLNHFVKKGKEFLSAVALELGRPNDEKYASRVVSSVFHTIRDRITTEESFHLISQLPLFAKAIYVDGWKPSKNIYAVNTLEEFLEVVRNKSPRTAEKDFPTLEDAKKGVSAVFFIVKQYASAGEIEHVKAQLPEKIAELLEV